MAGKKPAFGPIDFIDVPFVAPAVGERPIDRLFSFGDFVMVFGEPNHMMGRPTRLVPKPAVFPPEPVLTEGDDSAIVQTVKAFRKEK